MTLTPEREAELSRWLHYRTCEADNGYSPTVARELHRVNPDWFPHLRVEAQKAEIRRLADSGAPRPPGASKIGRALSQYLSESSKQYDADLREYLGAARPDWFSDIRISVLKAEIRHRAQNGGARPKLSSVLGKALRSFVSERSTQYDPDLKHWLRETRPDWFRDLRVGAQKAEIRRRAERGAPRPHHRTKLGQALQNFLSEAATQYDPDLKHWLRETRPDWFRDLRVALQKTEILRTAVDGEDRPPWDSKLGRALSEYTYETSKRYDPDFHDELKALRPNWFRN